MPDTGVRSFFGSVVGWIVAIIVVILLIGFVFAAIKFLVGLVVTAVVIVALIALYFWVKGD